MYRLETNFTGEYQLRDLDLTTFASIVTGGLVRVDAEEQARHPDSLVVYTGVWDPEANQYVNDLPEDLVASAYESWYREDLP